MRLVRRGLPFAFVAILLGTTTPVRAVKEFRTSHYAGGNQIWFEAETFDERDPAKTYQLRTAEAKLKTTAGVFGDAITNPRGVDGGWLLYRFDISQIGGKAGTWYFWGRVVNPNNQSDWLWVVGVDGKGNDVPVAKPKEIADAADVLAQAKHRIFEASIVTWTWDGGNREGHVHKLVAGNNTTMIFWRQSDSTDEWDTFVWSDTLAYQPTDDDYKNAKAGKSLAVNPLGKSAATWGELKRRFGR
jgi:hypothetical protein